VIKILQGSVVTRTGGLTTVGCFKIRSRLF